MTRDEIEDVVGDQPRTAREIGDERGKSPNQVRNLMRRYGVEYTRQRPRRYYKAVGS